MEIREEEQILKLVYEEARQQEKRIADVLSQIEDEELGDDLNRLLYSWKKFGEKAKKRMDENKKPDDADLVREEIRQSELMVERMKYMIHENKKAGIFATELAKELIDFEEQSVKKLKNYL